MHCLRDDRSGLLRVFSFLSHPPQSTPDKAEKADTEAPGTEQSAASEQASQSGSESGGEVAGNDGPGGHADEPGNANADHQAQGQE
jgi:hypothetical protein